MSNFTSRTIVEVLPPLFELLTHRQIDRVLLKLGLQNVAPSEKPGAPGQYFSKEDRAINLARYLIENPTLQGIYETNLTFEILDLTLSDISDDIAARSPSIINSLKRDGYTINNGKLRTLLPEEVQLTEKENRLNELLKKFKFTTAEGHLDQAIKAHTRSDWAATNSQLRSFIESLIESIADELALRKVPPIRLPPDNYNKREFLAKENFFQESLNEWKKGGGSSFVDGLIRRLHPEGSHPGLSDEVDSTFRLHLIILFGSYLLERFDIWPLV